MDIKKGILTRIVFCILGFSVFLSSCEWSTIEPIEVEVPEVVSFSSDIQPIFNDKCTVCHPNTAGLDLSEGNSYASINSGRINATTPSESLIYTKPDPNGTHSEKYSLTESAIVLSWIEEGALDN